MDVDHALPVASAWEVREPSVGAGGWRLVGWSVGHGGHSSGSASGKADRGLVARVNLFTTAEAVVRRRFRQPLCGV